MNVQLAPLENKKEAIFKHTLLLVQEKGFHGTPMSLIAQHASVAIGTIYHYFPSKNDLILSLFANSRKQLEHFIFEADDPMMPYKHRFYTHWKRFIKFYEIHPDIFKFFDQFYSSPYYQMVKDKQREEITCGENLVYNFLKQGIDDNILKNVDPFIISSMFLSSAIGIIKKNIIENNLISPSHIDDYLNILWDGVKQSNQV